MKPYENSLERILESAIVVSWADLMRGAQTGLIHIEHGFAAGGTFDYLRFGGFRCGPEGGLNCFSKRAIFNIAPSSARCTICVDRGRVMAGSCGGQKKASEDRPPPPPAH